jgi:hypothetical protein
MRIVILKTCKLANAGGDSIWPKQSCKSLTYKLSNQPLKITEYGGSDVQAFNLTVRRCTTLCVPETHP